jgi:2-oxoisovalerate dehydrogenase E1 component
MQKSSIDWQKVAQLVLLSRELDLLEEEQLTPKGKIKYQFSAKGHELSQILLAQALTYSHDAAALYYRSRPFMLASGLTLSTALAAGMARASSPTQGRDTGVVFNLPGRSSLTVLPASGDVGAQYTPAAGWAQAILYHQQVLNQAEWQGSIAVAHGGDGSIASNGFWSALVIATTQRLPVLFFIEDNRYGLSVPANMQTPRGNIAANLASFQNLCVMEAEGTDPKQISETISTAVSHVRSGEGPCLLRIDVPRLQGHTYIDDQAYKSQSELAEEVKRDPVTRLKSYLGRRRIISAKEWDVLLESVRAQLSTALETAETDIQPDPESATRHLFFDGSPPKQGGLRPENALPKFGSDVPQPSGPRINLIDAVRRTLESEMSLNSEEGIIGRSVGLALAGLLPIPEIQFRKYADPAYEQLNDLGSIRWRTANRFAAPVVVRIPVGFGKVTGDPWHSVTAEAIFAHTLGWRIAFPSNAEDAVGLLRAAMRGDDPTFFLEHRALLDTSIGRRPYPGDDYCLPFGVAAQIVTGDEITVISWGETVHRCLEASKKYSGRVTVLDLRTIIPWDKETVLDSVRSTGKVLIVHEDTITAGFGAEISATIAAEVFPHLDAPIQRLATPDMPIPYNIPMMESILPSVESIEAKLEELLAY